MTTLICRKCEAEKPEVEFRIRSDTGRRRTECSECKNAADQMRPRSTESLDKERAAKRARYQLRRRSEIERTQKYQRANPDRGYDAHLRKTFGITLEDYERVRSLQGDCCAVCRLPETVRYGRSGLLRRLHVDHNHLTGTIRGLLCTLCNVGLGCARDDPGRLRAMASYLERTA